MCNKICASFPLLSSSGSERGAAARCAGRAGSPRAPGEAGQTQKLGKEHHPAALCGTGGSQMQLSSCLGSPPAINHIPAAVHHFVFSPWLSVVNAEHGPVPVVSIRAQSERGAIGVNLQKWGLSAPGVTVCGMSLLGVPCALPALAPGAQGPSN